MMVQLEVQKASHSTSFGDISWDFSSFISHHRIDQGFYGDWIFLQLSNSIFSYSCCVHGYYPKISQKSSAISEKPLLRYLVCSLKCFLHRPSSNIDFEKKSILFALRRYFGKWSKWVILTLINYISQVKETQWIPKYHAFKKNVSIGHRFWQCLLHSVIKDYFPVNSPLK